MKEYKNSINEAISKNWFGDLLEKFIPDDIDIKSKTPEQIIKNASKKAAGVSFISALPTGFAGWATILPELAITTKIQINMIYSLAKFLNKSDKIDSSFIAIIYAEALGIDIIRTLVSRSGGKIVISNIFKSTLTTLFEKISIKITKKIANRLPARFVPIILAPIYAKFAYSSTKQLGKYTMIYLTKEILYQLPESNDSDIINT